MNLPPLVRLRLAANPGVEVAVRPTYSAAQLAAGIPFVVEARTLMEGGAVSARLEAVSLPLGWTIDISSEEWRAREDSSLRPALEATAGLRNVRIRLTARGESTEGEVAFVDPWHWPLDAESWSLIASFVLPHDGVVARLLAALTPGERGLRDLFLTLQRRTDLTYALPEVLRTSAGAALQRLRPPWVVFRDLARAVGSGHCLDLSLLAAGVLEASGQSPLILFVLDAEAYPVHAMVGCWREGGRRFRPMIRGAGLSSLLRSREIDLVDMVPICRDRNTSFEEARAAASRWIENADDVLAIDVLALRPPHGPIAPYELNSDSIVLSTIADAEQVAREFGSSTVDTSHLLCALWRTDGTIAREILSSTQSSRESEIESCRAPSTRPPSVTLERTRGFQRCLAEAREMARTTGSTIVREADLWWAVLGGRSASLDRVFMGRPEKRRALIRALSEISPPVRPESEG